MSLLTAEGVWKEYCGTSGGVVHVLRGASLEIQPGEFVAIYGASGTGKSTLLHTLGGLDAPNAGQIWFQGSSLYAGSADALAMFRNQTVGFVFQFYHLLPEFTAEENVMLPCILAGLSRRQAQSRAQELLAQVGLADRRAHAPHMLSGGEQQRVAIARALARSPKILLADEPTGNLDTAMGEHIMQILQEQRKACGAAMVMVTHNPQLLHHVDRSLELREGILHAA